MNAQFGIGAKSLATSSTGDAAHAGVQGLVGIQAVTPGGAEITVRALVRLHTFMLDADVLAEAAHLLAGEVTLAAGQLRTGFEILPMELAVES